MLQDILEQKKTIIIENPYFGLKNVSYLHFIEIVAIVFWHACASQKLSKLFGTTGIYWLNMS